MGDPFEIKNLKAKIHANKNLSYDEAFLDLQIDDATTLDDERDSVNYRVLGGIIFVCLCFLFGRILFLQVIKGSEYKILAEGNKLRIQYVLAPRGLVLDRFGKVIASNTPSFELDVITADLPLDQSQFLAELTKVAAILGKDNSELQDIIAKMQPKSYQGQTLVQDITKDQALILIAKQNDLKGFVADDSAIRDYKDSLVFTHLVGYTGKITQDELIQKNNTYASNDDIGKTGIEYWYEQFLHGTNGRKQAEIDAQGNYKRTLAEVLPVLGNNVKLNIDYDLQKTLYNNLTAELNVVKSKKAAAVITNPYTGEIMALVSLPSFDNNLFAKGISKDDYAKLNANSDNVFLNRAISGQYPPGSTIKPMMAVAALTEKVVTPQTKILDDGVIRVGQYAFYGYERSGLGIMDIYSAIARSSDIYFYSVGGGNPKSPVKNGLGPDKIAEYLRKFYLGQKLGIDLPAEKPGLVPDPVWKKQVKKETWYLGDTYHESIGQGDVLATPLQVNSWTATIANGGRVMQPYVLNEVNDKNGKILAKGMPKVLAENIFDPNVIKIVQDGMRQTVTQGTGRALNTLPIAVSAKTGTAQFDPHNPNRAHAWFTSYAPSDNPQIAVTVLVEGGGEGYAVGGPVAKAVYAWWAENRYKK